jgi:ferredoxin
VLGLFVGRPYCRFLCPYGALLRLTAAVAKWRVRITPDICTQCRLCADSCPYGVIREPVSVSLPSEARRRERRRFALLLGVCPLLLIGAGWLGAHSSRAASRLNPTVELAQRYLEQQSPGAGTNLSTVAELSLSRAEKSPAELLEAAVDVQRRFRLGGWIFGAWIGLVIGAKLLAFSFGRLRSDYEPERGGCFGCARCFEYCPQERVRLGWLPADAAPAGPPTHAPAVAAKESVAQP